MNIIKVQEALITFIGIYRLYYNIIQGCIINMVCSNTVSRSRDHLPAQAHLRD